MSAETAAEKDEHRANMIRSIRAALDTTTIGSADGYACPLHRVILANEFVKSRNAADYDAAHDLAAHTVRNATGSPYWLHGYLVLARRATLASTIEIAEVEHYLKTVEERLEGLESRLSDSVQNEAFDGAWEDDAQLTDPSLTNRQKLILLLRWALLYERWDDPTFFASTATADRRHRSKAIGEGLVRRIKARIAYERALLELRLGKPTESIQQHLADALRWDENLVPAQLEMARVRRRQGQFKAAESWLVTFVRQPHLHPLFKNDPRIWAELATVYAAWYEQESSATLARHADGAFVRFDSLAHGRELPEAYFAAARFYTVAAERLALHDTGTEASVANAEALLQIATRLGYKDSVQLADLRARIDRLQHSS